MSCLRNSELNCEDINHPNVIFHVATIRCFRRDSGERLSHAVGCAFAICLEKKQERDRLNVTMSFNKDDSTFTRFGSFRQATITERLQVTKCGRRWGWVTFIAKVCWGGGSAHFPSYFCFPTALSVPPTNLDKK